MSARDGRSSHHARAPREASESSPRSAIGARGRVSRARARARSGGGLEAAGTGVGAVSCVVRSFVADGGRAGW
ncbi:MAG: hypothetical protein E6I76_07340 [Chloroflexi bacterium]|nr:MAG: hypothetical protein E6I76_07340 [Chloroflexota bacterium]